MAYRALDMQAATVQDVLVERQLSDKRPPEEYGILVHCTIQPAGTIDPQPQATFHALRVQESKGRPGPSLSLRLLQQHAQPILESALSKLEAIAVAQTGRGERPLAVAAIYEKYGTLRIDADSLAAEVEEIILAAEDASENTPRS
jgi:hypothetical protein